MGHAMLSHHVRNKFILELKCHCSVATLENGGPINTKTNQPLGRIFLSQTPLLHKGLNNNNSKIICISTFNNTLNLTT